MIHLHHRYRIKSTGEIGTVHRPTIMGMPPAPLCYIVEFEQRSAKGEIVYVAIEEELELVESAAVRAAACEGGKSENENQMPKAGAQAAPGERKQKAPDLRTAERR